MFISNGTESSTITISFLVSDSIIISGRCDVGMTCGGKGGGTQKVPFFLSKKMPF